MARATVAMAMDTVRGTMAIRAMTTLATTIRIMDMARVTMTTVVRSSLYVCEKMLNV